MCLSCYWSSGLPNKMWLTNFCENWEATGQSVFVIYARLVKLHKRRNAVWCILPVAVYRKPHRKSFVVTLLPWESSLHLRRRSLHSILRRDSAPQVLSVGDTTRSTYWQQDSRGRLQGCRRIHSRQTFRRQTNWATNVWTPDLNHNHNPNQGSISEFFRTGVGFWGRIRLRRRTTIMTTPAALLDGNLQTVFSCLMI